MWRKGILGFNGPTLRRYVAHRHIGYAHVFLGRGTRYPRQTALVWVATNGQKRPQHKLAFEPKEDAMTNTTTTNTNDTTTTTNNILPCPTCGELLEPEIWDGTNTRCPCCKHAFNVRLFPSKLLKQNGNNGDEIVSLLAPFDVEDLPQAAMEILESLPEGTRFSKKMRKDFEAFSGNIAEFFEAKYEGRNPGMIRMNIGNVVRGAYKRAQV